MTPTVAKAREAVLALLQALASVSSTWKSPSPVGDYTRRLDALIAAVRAEERARLAREYGMGGAICKTHGMAVLVTHVDDGEPCSDYLLAHRRPA